MGKNFKENTRARIIVDNTCKNVYNRYYFMFESANFDVDRLRKIMNMDDYDKALEEFCIAIKEDNGERFAANLMSICGYSIFNYIFDVMYFYPRNLHFLIEDIPNNVDISDTRILNEVDYDFCLDIKYKGCSFGIFAYHREYPIYINNTKLDWTFSVHFNTPSLQAKKSFDVVRNSVSPSFCMHVSSKEGLRKLYIDFNESDKTDCGRKCSSCNKCTKISTEFANLPIELKVYPFKFRSDNDCKLITDLGALNPIDILKCILHTLDCYNSREVITRKNGRKATVYKQCKVHIAKENPTNDDKMIMLPLHEYVKEYRESHPYEYKGGHHASPVTHQRRGYYRKARKGNYILQDGQFIEVERGKGNFCFVHATLVNSKADRVIMYNAPVDKT